MNKSSILLILMLSLIISMGCAKPDWIQRTLVTVDVTGTWQNPGGNLELKLEQQGTKVTGSMMWRGLSVPGGTLSGTIDGTVAGDVFQFKQTSGTPTAVHGEMTVSGDEMTGRVQSNINFIVTLRRIDSSPPPRS